MPFNFFKSKDGTDYKARLERKMCVARDTPEPIFDLSACNLKTVPSGVFSLCKVLRKEALFLQKNCLNSLCDGSTWRNLTLLKVLDVHNNFLTALPDDLDLLTNLEVLNVSGNKLTSLPPSLGALVALQSFLASNNKLKNIPPSIVNCKRLISLDVRGNPLRALPFSKLQFPHLQNLSIDDGVSLKDIKAIESSDICDTKCTSNATTAIALENEYFLMQERFHLLQQQKEAQQLERLAWEKSLLETSEVAAAVSGDKEKLVKDILSMDNKIVEELIKFQEHKLCERSLLVQQCLTEDESINHAVRAILENTKRSQEQLARITDLDDQFQLSSMQNDTNKFDSHQVLDAMKDMVREEILKTNKLREYEVNRSQTMQHWIIEDSQKLTKLAELAVEHKSQTQKLAEMVEKDEQLQKAAVAVIMESSDARSCQLAQQVSAIEQQLAGLTRIEMDRRKSVQEEQLTELAESRIALSELLIDVLAQQQARREQLVTALHSLDSHKGDSQQYWMQQYNRILHSTSHRMVQAMQAVDYRLQQEMASYQVLHFLPLLSNQLISRVDIEAVDEESLTQAGVESVNDRVIVLKAIKTYLELTAPSAPPLEHEASAPPLPATAAHLYSVETECVVCMVDKADVVFLPCGHVCCCWKCGDLGQCPLCRSAIHNNIHPNFH